MYLNELLKLKNVPAESITGFNEMFYVFSTLFWPSEHELYLEILYIIIACCRRQWQMNNVFVCVYCILYVYLLVCLHC